MQTSKNKFSFEQQLTITFAFIAIVFLFIITTIIFESNKLTSTTNLIKQLHLPSTQETQKLTTGIHHSLASLRAWIILNDDQFKFERAKAWQQEIQPSIEALEKLSQNWSNPRNKTRLDAIKERLIKLSVAQNQIEKIANEIESQPALQLLQDLAPVANSIAANITTMIDLEEQLLATDERKLLLKNMADFRGSLGLSLAAIRLYLLSDDSKDKNQFNLHWATNSKSFDILVSKKNLMSKQQQIIFNQLQRDRQLFNTLPQQIINIRQSDTYNITNTMLAEEIEPEAQIILQLLRQLNADQTAHLEQDFQRHHGEIAELTQFISASIGIGILVVILLGAAIARSLKQMRANEVKKIALIEQTQIELQNSNENLILQNEFSRQMELISSSIQSHKKLDDLCNGLINTLAEFTNASFGALYLNQSIIKTTVDNSKSYLICYGRFAIDNKTNQEKIPFGSGFVGQCAVSKKPLTFAQIPQDYLKVHSGLGQTQSYNLLLMPILIETKIIGVIELASFKSFTDKQLQSISNITPNIAIGINNQIYIEQVQTLLEQTQQQSAVLEEKTYRLEQKNLEIAQSQQLLEQRAQDLEQSNRYKSDFLATMSHEIRTPMNGVLGMLELLSNSKLTKSQIKKVDMAQSSAKSLLSIINDILDFSKIDAGKLEFEILPFNLLDLLAELCETFALKAQEKNLELVLDTIGITYPQVKGDPVRVRQILTNLISNAIKFTAKGRILIVAKTTINPQGQLVFDCFVDDTGIGVDSKNNQYLFEPFKQADASTTRNFGGTGLGLSIVKKLVTKMSGDIYLVEKQSPGSQFRFNIELALENSEPLIEPDFSHHNILLVGENSCLQEVIGKQLKHWQGTVSTMTSTQLLTQSIDKQQSFSLVVIDLSESEGGLDIATLLRDIPEYQAVKLVALTNININHDHYLEIEDIFDSIISKPIYFKNLQKCANLLDVKQQNPVKPTAAPEQISNNKWPTNTRVLLVEDNFINQEVAKEILSQYQLHTDTVANGEEALNALNIAKEDQPYSIILMDCQMPVMDGFTATKEIRAGKASDLYRNTPIIALTANAMSGDKETCLAAGMSDYLSKPVEPLRLKAMLEKWL